MTAATDRIDSRAWMVWAVAAMAPELIGRHPLVIAEILVIVIIVRQAWAADIERAGLGWFLRLGAVVLAISVLFNVLTVHAGDRVLARLPEGWPVIGGPLTANALVYGCVSAVALFTLLLVGVTTGALLSWMDLFHLLPRRLAPIAVAGSVAWAFLPRTATAFHQIREAQMLRGHRLRTGRDLLPLIVPLLAGGLERSLTTAEALEARGFGASMRHTGEPRHPSWLPRVGLVVALVALIAGAYCLLVGYGLVAIALLVVGSGVLTATLVLPARDGRSVARTRYREAAWRRHDTIVSASAGFVLLVVVITNSRSPESLRFNPYPTLAIPAVDLPLMIALAALLMPVMFAPGQRQGQEADSADHQDVR
jgi:energy-coupling factor transport system permease protein